MIKIGLVQASVGRDVLENIKTIEKYVADAKNQGCEAVCFPECFLTGYHPEEAVKLAVGRDNKWVQTIAGLAVDYQIDILAGFMESEENLQYISQGIFKASGVCDYYRKTHLGEKEEEYFAKGNVLEVFTLSCGAKIGMQICVETHFPQITQTLSLKGADVIFAPHAVPRAAGNRKNIWSKIIPARSYDNRVYMACCNQWDEEKFGGGSMVTDPKGEVIAEYFKESAGLLVAELDLEEVRRYRQENAGKRYRYYASKGRKELYQ